MTEDVRKGGGMWSFDVKLSRALDLQLPCPAASKVSKWLVWNFAAGGDADVFSIFKHHLLDLSPNNQMNQRS